MAADEVGTLEALKASRREVVDPAIADHNGRIVKTIGDGMLVEFASAVDAVTCAMAVQAKMAERTSEPRITFRIGINVGDIIIDGDDIFGDGVNVAARVENECEPGSVLISANAFEQIRSKTPFAFNDLGEKSLKNIDRPIRVYAVRSQEARSQDTAAASANSTFPDPSKPLPLPDKPSIAVLPFQNMSGDPEQEYFADGMVEDIITALSRFKSLFVIARNSSFTYKGKAVDIKQVGRELGVRYVLEGSVRKASGRVRITGQLIDAATGAHLWADKFDAELNDVFELQDTVTTGVVGAIAPRLAAAEREGLRRKPVQTWDAYDYYLQGMERLSVRTPDGRIEARSLFKRAIDIDSTLAAAYARAAQCAFLRLIAHRVPISEEERNEALNLAERALALGSEDEVVLSITPFVFSNLASDWPRACAIAERGTTLNPNNAAAWNAYGWMTLGLGRPAASVDPFQRAMRLNPVDPFIVPNLMYGLSSACFLLERYEEGINWAQRMLVQRSAWDMNGLVVLFSNAVSCGQEELADKTAQMIRSTYPDLRVSFLKKYFRGPDPIQQAKCDRVWDLLGLPE